jgi:hypothetical protein
VNREANCTAANITAKSTQAASVEGACPGREEDVDSVVIVNYAEIQILK